MPAVIDADGLNILAKHIEVLARLTVAGRTVVLAPHPGRWRAWRGCPPPLSRANRLDVARNFAREHNVTVVLKGARTLIAHRDGRVAVNTTGNPGMAKGGSGDLLTGMVAGLLAQFRDDSERAVEAAVFLHGLAADLAVRELDEHTLLATDSLPHLSQAFRFRSCAANGYVWLQGCRRVFGRNRAPARGSKMSEEAPVAEGRVHEFTTRSGADTVEVGRKLAALLKPPQLLLLRGELGTGKTTLVKRNWRKALDAAELRRGHQSHLHAHSTSMTARTMPSPSSFFTSMCIRLESERQLETLGLNELLTSRRLGPGRVGRQVQEHQETGHRGSRDQFRRR